MPYMSEFCAAEAFKPPRKDYVLPPHEVHVWRAFLDQPVNAGERVRRYCRAPPLDDVAVRIVMGRLDQGDAKRAFGQKTVQLHPPNIAHETENSGVPESFPACQPADLPQPPLQVSGTKSSTTALQTIGRSGHFVHCTEIFQRHEDVAAVGAPAVCRRKTHANAPLLASPCRRRNQRRPSGRATLNR